MTLTGLPEVLMRGFGLVVVLPLFACSSADFELASPVDAGVEDSASADAGADSVPDDGAVPPDDAFTVDAPCTAPEANATDVYVSETAAPGGKGSAGCPFRTLREAADLPLASGVKRIVHVRGGSYNEARALVVRGGETYAAEGSSAKLTTGGLTVCSPGTNSCAVHLESNGAISNFLIEAASASVGIFTYSTGLPPSIRGVTVRGAKRDGIVIGGTAPTAALLGPNVRSNENGNNGLSMRGTGNLVISGSGNAFNSNAKAPTADGSLNMSAGIQVVSGSLALDGGTNANSNYAGVLFDSTGSSGAPQFVGQLTAQGNKGAGVIVSKGFRNVTLRRSTLTKNGGYGLILEWNSLLTNAFDIGNGAIGGNVFGGANEKNNFGGVLLCGSPQTGTVKAEANYWTVCQPAQVEIANCESYPASYADIAYVPQGAIGPVTGAKPVASATTCNVGP